MLGPADRYVEKALIERRVCEGVVHPQHDDGVVLQAANVGDSRQDRASGAITLLSEQDDFLDSPRLAEIQKAGQVEAVAGEDGDAGVRQPGPGANAGQVVDDRFVHALDGHVAVVFGAMAFPLVRNGRRQALLVQAQDSVVEAGDALIGTVG